MHSNYLLILVLTVILSVIVNSDGHIDFEFLARFDGLKADKGTTESCVYDPINGLWRVWDRNMSGEADSLSGNYPFNDIDNFIQGREGAGNETSAGVAGTVFVSNSAGNFVYIADIITGEIYQYNVDTEELGPELDTTYGFGANGLCYDQENNMLYATNVGIDFFGTGLPLADTSNIVRFSLDDAVPTAQTIYLSGRDTLKNSDGEIVKETNDAYTAITGENYTFRPNGCTIKDGMAYFVETRTDGLGGLLTYDIDQDTFVLNTAIPGYPGDGLITIGNYLIMSSWGTGSDTGFLSYYDLDSDSDGTFIELVDSEGNNVLSSPADIGVDLYGTICIPSLNEGYLYFYKFSADGAGYKVLDKEFDFTSIAGVDAAISYSVAYDTVNDAFIFINNYNIETYIPDVHEITASNILNLTDENDFGYETIDLLSTDSSVINQADYDENGAFYWGLSIVDERLFLVDSYGLFVEADLDSKTVRNFVELLPDGFSYYQGGLQGVCNDPDNSNIFYITSTNGYIFSVDISNDTVKLDDNDAYLVKNNWKVNIIYDATDITDQNNENEKIYYPYDCTVADGKIYFVEFTDSTRNFVENPGLGIYDIDSGEFMYNTDLFSYRTGGISSAGNNTLVIGLYDPPAVLVSTLNNDGSRRPFQIIAAGDSFSNIDNIFKVAIDYQNGLIVIAGTNSNNFLGYFSFIQSDNLILNDEIITSTKEPDTSIIMESTEDNNPDSTNTLSTIFSIILY